MNSEVGSNVEACSWDLTMGAAANVFGRIFLRTTSSSSSSIPEAIDHVGIIVFNRLYEYGYRGVLKSSIPRDGEEPTPQYLGCKLRKREALGRTTKDRRDFMEWLVNMRHSTFKGSNYHVVSHNCLHFAQAACAFLGVTPAPNWQRVEDWVRANQRLMDVITRGLMTPSQRRALLENGRTNSLQEEGQGQAGQQVVDDPPPAFPGRRRRFSISALMGGSGGMRGRRSASLETLPPTYEEALRMRGNTENSTPAPNYEDLE